jgi:ergothioneine biosynthesis protein EgtB
MTELVTEQADGATSLAERLAGVRGRTVELTIPLTREDMVIQASEEASPTKWHLGHTTWFFETLVLRPHAPSYEVFSEAFSFCFNSYYESLGTRQPRTKRGLLSRPSLDDVLAYRRHVDQAIDRLLRGSERLSAETLTLIEIGIQHEQQHQELLLSDVLALFAANPLRPVYQKKPKQNGLATTLPVAWVSCESGLREMGHRGEGFAWDNELPPHHVFLEAYQLANRLVTNGEWLEFIGDGGYQTPSLWLADGWSHVQSHAWMHPLYWEMSTNGWMKMSLHGLLPLSTSDPVSHISYYEADAYARWCGKRLPTEFEWEAAAREHGSYAPCKARRPLPARSVPEGDLQQMTGALWQWTASAYLPYPGFQSRKGTVSEYNAKFMVGQHVVRGSSLATAPDHARITYRNFFHPHQRWQFLGLRLAASI